MEDNSTEIKRIALRFLTKREYSKQELTAKLLRKFPSDESIIDELLERFIVDDWLSEQRFVEAMIGDQIIKRQGPLKIKMKLINKGVAEDLIEKGLSKFYPESLQETIKSLLSQRKRIELQRRDSSISSFEIEGKIKQWLYGRGFV